MMGVNMRQPPRGLPAVSATSMARNGCYICASLSANTVEGMLAQEVEAKETGADVMEIRLDLIHDFEAKRDLPRLMNARSLPAIITYRFVCVPLGHNNQATETTQCASLLFQIKWHLVMRGLQELQ